MRDPLDKFIGRSLGRRASGLTVLVATSVLTAAPAPAPGPGSPAGSPPGTPVEIGDPVAVEGTVADVDLLGLSLRELQVDLRNPHSFDRVYRVLGRDDLLMRISGGLYAIFPRSQYTTTKEGLVPIVPNDTVFHVGMPDATLLPPRSWSSVSPMSVMDPGAAPAPAGAPPWTPAALPDPTERGGATARLDFRLERRVPVLMMEAPDSAVPLIGEIGEISAAEPPSDVARRPTAHPSAGAATHGAVQDVIGTAASVRTIATDPLYRTWRLRELILQAALGESSPSSSK